MSDDDKLTATINAMSRPNPYPELTPGDQVMLPPELGNAVGRIKWASADGGSWAVVVPFGGDGALVYVYKADVRPVST